MHARFPVRGFIVAAIVLLLGWCFQVLADDSAKTAQKSTSGETARSKVRIETNRGEVLDGYLLSSIKVTTETGSQEILPEFIKRITFRPAGSTTTLDVLELTDRNQVRGKIDPSAIEILINQEHRRFAPSELRELKAVADGSTGLLAILFGLLTLTAMEIVLGIDNIIFLAIIAGKLPKEQQPRARKIGLGVALGTRLLLLAFLWMLLGLTKPIFTLPDLPLLHDLEAREISLRDLILLVGGAFLVGKSTVEIHDKFEAHNTHHSLETKPATSFAKVVIQIGLIDIIFSLDSVITAVGMVEEIWIMVAAMFISMFVMLAFAGSISDFVARHPTLKILALSFLILIGVMLVAESLGQHINKGYIYFAMAFAVCVEMINLRVGRKSAGKAISH